MKNILLVILISLVMIEQAAAQGRNRSRDSLGIHSLAHCHQKRTGANRANTTPQHCSA